MPKLKRRLSTLALIVAGGLLLVPASGEASTIFGSRLNHDPTQGCGTPDPCTVVSFIHPSEPNGDPYSGGAPVDGVITKFRLRAYVPTPSPVTLLVSDINLPDPNNPDSALATAAGVGPTVTVPSSEASEVPILEFPARLAVKKGQHLGLASGPDTNDVYDSSGSEFSYVFAPPLVAGSGARGSTEVTGELLVQATIEPDADGDGFGDETQDKCPTQKTTQGACDVTGPAVSGFGVSHGTISYQLSEAATVSFQLEKKAPARKVGKKCVKQTAGNKKKKKCPLFKKVGAAFAGSGTAGANSVTLPNGKKLKPGSYRLTMTATDASGNVSSATTSFKVAGKKKPLKK
jgi:hypothetical protein